MRKNNNYIVLMLLRGVHMAIKWEIIFKLILASILGGLIGLDRESTNRPAGFRTHTLVSIGSALIMLVSIYIGQYGADPSRIAAQVISGIGFLGAGTILRTRTNIEGLTTAASLWVCAGIGLATGLGYYLGAIVTTITVLFFLRYSKAFERSLRKSSYKSIEIIGLSRAGLIGDVGTLLGRYNIIIRDISIISIEEDNISKVELHFSIKLPHKMDLKNVIQELYLINDILSIKVDERLMNIDKK